MSPFIANARHDLRLPLRLEAQLAVAGAGYLAHTEDVGARGCRLLAPVRLHAGTKVRLLLLAGGAEGSLSAGATVVWRQDGLAWRHGLAFAAADDRRSADWFDGLLEGRTALLHRDQVPDRIRLGDRVYVVRTPREPPTADEALVLRHACGGASVGELRGALGARWSRIQRALFALLDQGLVAIEPALTAGSSP